MDASDSGLCFGIRGVKPLSSLSTEHQSRQPVSEFFIYILHSLQRPISKQLTPCSSPPRETKSHSATQEIPCLLRKPKVH
jgi:hypothetical protein